MSTRRIISNEKSILEKDDADARSPPAGAKSDISPAVPAFVIYTLLSFTFLMVVGPLSTYYLTLNYVYKGNSSYAGATAALMANIVVFAYVIVAMREDNLDQIENAENAEKDRKSQ
ncbi:MAG: putative ubiquinone biosynthesis monooxygenase [Chaenotheca gracillima]|nr:MAG: putative ubiquinone biosynthesis monooxygenase [Chaenotheca gracillima]